MKRKNKKIPFLLKHCEWCGKPYSPAPNARNPKYDTPTCKMAAWRERQRQIKLRALATPTTDELALWSGLVRYCGGYSEVHDAIERIWKYAPVEDRMKALDAVRVIVQLAVESHTKGVTN